MKKVLLFLGLFAMAIAFVGLMWLVTQLLIAINTLFGIVGVYISLVLFVFGCLCAGLTMVDRD